MHTKNSFLIESLIGLGSLMLIVVALGFYMLNEQLRIVDAQAQVLSVKLDEAMTLYAENCSVCHGVSGEGIGATPPLNNPALKTMPFEDIYKTISRGRYQTAMPAWAIEDGGPLSDYQIDELVALIGYGDWNETGDRVGQSAAQFVRQGLDALHLGSDLTSIPWGSKKLIRLPSSALAENQRSDVPNTK